MELKPKHQWSVEETNCFLALWASSEVQHKLEGATRTKPVFKHIQLQMAAAGYDRSVDQIINKLKKLKKEYREKKKDIERSGNGRPRKFPHFEVIDAVLGVRPACQLAGSLNSAKAICGSTMTPTLQQQPTYSELSIDNEEEEQQEPLRWSSPVPSTSSSGSSQQSQRSKLICCVSQLHN